MRVFFLTLLTLLGITVDQISKYFAVHTLSQGESLPVIGEMVSFTYAQNFGIAFSLPIEWSVLQVLTVVVIVFLLFHYTREEYRKHSKLLDVWYSLIFAWALSHAYDRLIVWHVIDFISVKYFAILNFADIFISVGVIFILIAYVRTERTSE